MAVPRVTQVSVLTDDTYIYWCETCGTVRWSEQKHFPMGVQCPRPDWKIRRLGELSANERSNARIELTPCPAENPTEGGGACRRYAGHKPPHIGTVPPVGRQRKPRPCTWVDGDEAATRTR